MSAELFARYEGSAVVMPPLLVLLDLNYESINRSLFLTAIGTSSQ